MTIRLPSRGLAAVVARARPPAIDESFSGADWKFEARALADDFRAFNLDASGTDRATISMFDNVGDDGEGGGITDKRIAGILRQVGNRPLTVQINSPGGNYFQGVAVYNQLRQHPAHIRVEILGVAASAASIIAMAGDEIAIAHNAEIMIHEARGLFFGTKSEMRQAFEVLEHVDAAMVSTYAARSGRDAAEFEEMIAGRDVYFTGQQAIDAGLADVLMERDAQALVYASADDFPSDKASLDRFLAKHEMPRSARRELYRHLAPGTPSAATPATPNAGREPGQTDLDRLLAAMTL